MYVGHWPETSLHPNGPVSTLPAARHTQQCPQTCDARVPLKLRYTASLHCSRQGQLFPLRLLELSLCPPVAVQLCVSLSFPSMLMSATLYLMHLDTQAEREKVMCVKKQTVPSLFQVRQTDRQTDSSK